MYGSRFVSLHEPWTDIWTVPQPPGISYLAAMFLLNMSPAEAFLALVNVVEKSFLKSFYANNLDEVRFPIGPSVHR